MCSACPVGQIANMTGQSVCASCDVGYTSYEGGNMCYPTDAPAPASVEAVVTLKVNVNLAVASTPAFQQAFVTDIADVLGVNASRVRIDSVTAGSVLIDFTILPSTSASGPWASFLASTLVALVAQPNSTLAQKIPVDATFTPQVKTRIANMCPLPQQGPDLSFCKFSQCMADFERRNQPCVSATPWCKPTCKCTTQECRCDPWYVCVCVCVCVRAVRSVSSQCVWC
jgi:hypothetical protein